MTNQKDPLAALFTSDARANDRQKLAELLRPFVTIDENSKEFIFHDSLNTLKSNTQKIEIILCAVKARSMFFNEADGLPPGDILALGTMPEGSVKTSLKKLYDDHKIKKDKEGRYFLPSYRISELIKNLSINK